jgi:hypothetical protein
MGLFVSGMVGLLTACGSPGGEGCGGVEAQVSCVSITSIQPTSTAGGDSSDVDVVQNPDCDGDLTTIDPETFTKHDAIITFTNRAHPSADGSLNVSLESLRLTYQVSNCPPPAVCPPLTGLSQNVSLDIPEESEAEGTFDLVPISTKLEFLNLGGNANAFPTYTANYVFTARTQFFSDTITINGSVNITLGSFNLCP